MQPANDNRGRDCDPGWGLKERAELAKAILGKHYPDGGAPEGLMISMVKAMGFCQVEGIRWAYRAHGHSGPEYDGLMLETVVADLTKER